MIFSKKSVLSVSLFILILWGVVLSTFANPPTSPYAVSQNITDPACAPSSLNCYVANISIGDTVGNSPDQNGILYTNATGQVTTDPLFTRDSSTHNTNILQTFDADIPSNQYIVTVANLGISEYISPGSFTIGETITGDTSGATATISYLFETGDVVMYLENIVGTFTAGETITGGTSGVTAMFYQFLPLPTAGGSFTVLDTGVFAPSGTATIDSVSGNTFTVTVTAGTLNQHDIILDDPASYAAGILSVTPVPAGITSVTQGFRTQGINGSELVWSPVIGSLRSIGVGTKGVQWTAGGNTFYLPETIPTIGQSLSIIGNTGSEYRLGWGGSTGPISINGSTLYSSGLDSTGDYDGENIFLGNYAGENVNNVYNSNFFGQYAGSYANNAYYSNFLGNYAGSYANNAYYSNFLGQYAGFQATDAYSSNFFGPNAGYQATNAYSSNFLGTSAGYQAYNANSSNFFGSNAGQDAYNANNSNFLGNYAGSYANNAYYSNFLGYQAGFQATDASYSNFFGPSAGYYANNANNSNFLGNYAGSYANNAYYSNFLGQYAGFQATDASYSNFLGLSAGNNATGANNSNFLGNYAGYTAINAEGSNFFGNNAGYNATYGSYSNFFGHYAGQGATIASSSNFFGAFAGQSATNAYFSNFFGEHAGHNATDASNSNFFGYLAGLNATSASNSIFIGKEAGNGDTVNNTTNPDDFSILIGPNTKTGGFSNSIALGGYATNTATNQLMIGSATRPIDTLVLTGSGGNTCVLDVTVASPSCSSDETLKTNITDLSTSTLENLLKVKTVSYNWKNYPDKGSQIGFLAQDLEQYFPEVVSVAPNGFKTVSYGGMTPILVEAMREMDLKITNITNPTEESSIVDKIIAKLIKADRVETKELCVDDVCVTRDQFLRMVESSGQTPTVTPPTTPDPTPNPPTCVEPQVLNEEGDACIDPVTETPSVETATPEPPPAEEPSVPTE